MENKNIDYYIKKGFKPIINKTYSDCDNIGFYNGEEVMCKKGDRSLDGIYIGKSKDGYPVIQFEHAVVEVIHGELFKKDKLNDALIEFEKCKNSIYYFATKYLTINNKPFSTYLTEDEFNNLIKNYDKSNKTNIQD